MLDLSSTQHLTSAFISNIHQERSSGSDNHNMADFLNAFEAFLSGGGATTTTATEADGNSSTSEAAESDVLATAETASLPGSGEMSPMSSESRLPLAERGTGVKMPPDKLLSASRSPSHASPSLFARRESPPSTLQEVPSAASPDTGRSCDMAAAASPDLMAVSESGSSVLQPPTISRTSVPQIKPIVPPIKLRKVNPSKMLIFEKVSRYRTGMQ